MVVRGVCDRGCDEAGIAARGWLTMGRGVADVLDVSAHHGPARCSAPSYEHECQRGVMVNAPTLDAMKRRTHHANERNECGAVPIRREAYARCVRLSALLVVVVLGDGGAKLGRVLVGTGLRAVRADLACG